MNEVNLEGGVTTKVTLAGDVIYPSPKPQSRTVMSYLAFLRDERFEASPQPVGPASLPMAGRCSPTSKVRVLSRLLGRMRRFSMWVSFSDGFIRCPRRGRYLLALDGAISHQSRHFAIVK
jgi:hypothetical protein